MQVIGRESNPSVVSHKWEQIELIEPQDEGYDFQEIDSLQRQWLEIKRQAEAATPDAYKEFTEQLSRSWAIETGIIEGIYNLEKGVTATLVEKGINASFIERSSTNKEPEALVEILRDHQSAIKSVDAWIRDGRPLTKWFMKQLHTQFMNHQDSIRTESKGEFKKKPNWSSRPDGSVHEYCPPEQVEIELENLLFYYEEYENENRHPLLLAAWLHHRFAQIHPFEDGNGRVGRAILTWHLVRKEFFPIVISRDDRTEYIDALEGADAGNLVPLIDLFARLQKNTILRAISAAEPEAPIEPEPQADLIDQIVGNAVERVRRRRQSEAAQMRSVNDIAQALRAKSANYLESRSQPIKDNLEKAGIYVEPQLLEGGPDRYNEYYYRTQVFETANEFGHWVNPNEPRYFVRLSLNTKGERTPRLLFVISLHNIGRRLTGIMSATAFAEIEYRNGETSTGQDRTSGNLDDIRHCAVNPFTFTWNDSADDISERFVKWTELCFANALQYWSPYLT